MSRTTGLAVIAVACTVVTTAAIVAMCDTVWESQRDPWGATAACALLIIAMWANLIAVLRDIRRR